MDTVDIPRKLWEHPDPQSTQMYILMEEINKKENLHLEVRIPVFVYMYIYTLTYAP
jgi:acetoacetyl-CoA synthetase